MIENINNMLIYNTIVNGRKHSLFEANAITSTLGFNFSFISKLEEKNVSIRDAFLTNAYYSLHFEYKDNVDINSFKLPSDFDWSKENIEKYNSYSDEDKKFLEELFIELYGSLEEGIKNDFYLIDTMNLMYSYKESFIKVFGEEVYNKFNNFKLFSLGYYSDDDIKIYKELKDIYEAKVSSIYDLSYKDESDIFFHDNKFNITYEDNKFTLENDEFKYVFEDANILNKDYFDNNKDNILDGYCYDIFKYKNSDKYVIVLNFNGVDIILVEYKTLICE